MKQIHYFKIILLVAIVTVISCSQTPTIDYKHDGKSQVISCKGSDDVLLNELLYTFEADLQYGYRGFEEGQPLSTSYGQFLYEGFSGTAEYTKFASPHAIQLKEALIAEGILITTGVKSNLNYKHPVVQCIINNIEDKNLAHTIQALIDTNTMDPTLFNSRLRNFGRDAQKNRYQALYVALDGYFQRLTSTERVVTPDE